VITYHTMSDCKDRGLVHRDRPLLPSSRRHHQTVGLTSAENGCWAVDDLFRDARVEQVRWSRGLPVGSSHGATARKV